MAAGTFALLTAGLPYGPFDFIQIAAGQYSSGGGGGTTTPPATVLGSSATASQIAAALTGGTPVNVTATIDAAAGGIVIAGNVGIAFPPGSLAGVTGPVTITFTANPNLTSVNQGGPSAFSANGTIFNIEVRDSTGKLITTFPNPVVIVTKPNDADKAMGISKQNVFGLLAGGFAQLAPAPSSIPGFDALTLGYVIDADSPEGENPNHFPIGTLVIVAPSVITKDPVAGVISANLNFIGSVVGVVTNPVGYVQTLTPNAPVLSSFDQSNAQVFSNKSQFTYLQVTEPQIGNRLLVIDPDTNNYAYVNATDVGPSGPPPARSSAAVVRGVLGNTPGVVHGLLQD